MNIGYDTPYWGCFPKEPSSLGLTPTHDDMLELMRQISICNSPLGRMILPSLYQAQRDGDVEFFREILPRLRCCLDRESKKVLAEFESIYEILNEIDGLKDEIYKLENQE